MIARALMWLGLVTVAGAAAVLSFAALRDLARMCGFTTSMAPLLPVVVDAGAAVASLVWLGRSAPVPARRFARALALVLLGGAVAGNALGHGLAAYGARPHWLVVVAVSAVAPAVLGAVVHLAVLATHPVAAVVRSSGPAPDHGADLTGPADRQADHRPGPAGPPDHRTRPDRPRTTVSPTDLDLAAELAELAGRSGAADRPGAASEQPPAVVPNHLDDDPTLLADLGGWAADQAGRPSRNAVMRRYGIGATRANQLLYGLSGSGAGPAPDQGDRGPDHGGPAIRDDGEVTL